MNTTTKPRRTGVTIDAQRLSYSDLGRTIMLGAYAYTITNLQLHPGRILVNVAGSTLPWRFSPTAQVTIIGRDTKESA